jgi:hypothetical protein
MNRNLRGTIGGILLSLLLCGMAKAGDPADANRAALLRELANMAVAAQRHYFTPASMAGGNGAFDNSWGGVAIASVSQLTRRPTTPVGTFTLGTVAADRMTIYATGTSIGYDGNLVTIFMDVFPDSTYTSIAN